MKNGKNNNKKGIALSLMALAGLLALNTPAAASDNVTINDPIAYASTTNIPSQYDIFKTIGEDPFANLPNDIKWEELSAKPSEGTTNVIEVKLPNNDNRYYQYDLSSFDTKEYAKKYENLEIETHSHSVYAGGMSMYLHDCGALLINNETDESFAIRDTLFKNIVPTPIAPDNQEGRAVGYIIDNHGTISEINADFINNSANLSNSETVGISHQYGIISNINGNFIGNDTAISNSPDYGWGGDDVVIEHINGNFIANDVAISNSEIIEDIKGNFIANNRAINNYRNIENITGNFINNGTAINSIYDGKIKNVVGNFIGNGSANERDYNSHVGSAIYVSDSCTIENITGNFISNYSTSYMDQFASAPTLAIGGAIYYNGGTNRQEEVSNNVVNSTFINNYTTATNQNSFGGAIGLGRTSYYIPSKVNIKNSVFYNNYAVTDNQTAKGGAIYSEGNLSIIADNGVSEFTGNYVQVGDGAKDYQAIFMNVTHDRNGTSFFPELNLIAQNNGKIILNDKIAGAEQSNCVKYERTYGDSYSLPDNISQIRVGYQLDGDNIVKSSLYKYMEGYDSSYDPNYDKYMYTRNIIDNDQNVLRSYKYYYDYNNGSNIYHVFDDEGNETTYKVSQNYSNNTYNVLDDDGNIIKTFGSQSKYCPPPAYGYQVPLMQYKLYDENDNISSEPRYAVLPIFDEDLLKNINHIYYLNENNETTSETKYYTTESYFDTIPGIEESSSGRIVTYYVLDDDNNVVETYRTVNYYGNDSSVGYYLLDENNNIIDKIQTPIDNYLVAKDNLMPVFKRSININIDGDPSGTVLLNNNIEGYNEEGKTGALNINLRNTNLHLANRDNVLDNNNLNLYSGTLNMINGQAGVAALNSLTLKGNTNFVGDVDLKTETMDRFTAKNYGQHSGFLNVVGLNITDDMQKDKMEVSIPFAESGLKDNVMVNGSIENTLELPNSKYQLTAYTPIYKYNVTYDNKDDMGYFVFARGGKSGGGNVPNNYNPAVLASPVNIQAASNASINETFKYVFEHADAFTQLPSTERLSLLKENQYALSTDFNQNLGYVANEFNNKSGWFRPYVTFENMHLKNGPTVDAITYGSLVGFDSDFQHYKHGWTGVTTGYIGYNGSQLSYGGVDTSMNGGLLGLTQTLYKGNFWTALTLSAGANVGESNTMYGKEDFTSLLAGIGSKTGYNFEFKEGKFIIQPIMFLSYTFVNTFDYTNAAGVKINSDPMHSILLNPSIRFITNTKNGWQPYLSVGMVWNVMNENQVFANNVKLPEMSIKPYVEYGLGIQKRFKDNFTAFGQAMIRNGGRNGISLTSGIRWSIGKSKNVEKVQHQDRKVIKTL